MRLKILVIIAMGCVWLPAQSQDENDRLVRLLADDKTRATTVADIVASGHDKLPLLLSWAANPPDGLDLLALNAFDVGLADIFGRLKTKEAIPFLVKNIGLQRSIVGMPGFGLKADQVIIGRLPAVAALIDIGTPALESLEQAFYGAAPVEERLPLIFAISHIVTAMSRQDPERENAQGFLISNLAEINLQRRYAQDALNALERLDR